MEGVADDEGVILYPTVDEVMQVGMWVQEVNDKMSSIPCEENCEMIDEVCLQPWEEFIEEVEAKLEPA